VTEITAVAERRGGDCMTRQPQSTRDDESNDKTELSATSMTSVSSVYGSSQNSPVSPTDSNAC
jgi:hypothetical protein